jgi:hypothetical protein
VRARTALLALLLITAGGGRAAAQLGQLVSPGPLARTHAKLEGISNCEKCHERGKQVSAARCLSCHEPVAKRIAARTGVHRDVTDACTPCHSEHGGLDAPLVKPIDAASFDHKKETGFALEGLHAPVQCAACHKTRSFLTASPACASCHADVHKPSLGPDCASCHSTAVPFKQAHAAFDHSRAAFKLEGAHATVPCEKCHAKQVFRGIKFDTCTACHRSPHPASMGTAACTTCHTTQTWKTSRIDHDRTTFPLAGKHAQVLCASCHVKPAIVVRLKADTCAACHGDPHKGVFKQDCAACHTVNGFKPAAAFDHAARTRFPLVGKHAQALCVSCHKSAAPEPVPLAEKVVDFRGAKTECASCHEDVHRGQLGTACQSCHAAEAPSFKPATFSHERSSFPLTGKHAGVACDKCHKTETSSFPSGMATAVRYKGIATECRACHADVHLGQLEARCETCHTTSSFAVTSYRHKTPASFFAGLHSRLPCADCHKKIEAYFPAGPGVALRFTGLAATCQTCHRDVHQGALGDRCESCHSVNRRWTDASRAFHKNTLLPLEGKHLNVPCASCHIKGELKGTPTRCYDCHWIRRQDDRFRTLLGNACSDCHRPTSWRDVQWNHAIATGFPLNGAHQLLDCASCHTGQVFRAGNMQSCYSCHRPAFERSINPNHVAAGFPTQCDTCHRASEQTWRQGRFDHASVFLLQGVHAQQLCSNCHKNSVYKGTSRDCVGCHLPEFQKSASPNHAAAGFPTQCDTCHRATDTNWREGRFDHASVFQLQGVHGEQPCATCHKNNVYKGTPRTCVGCHMLDFRKSRNPNHSQAGFSTTCNTCHGVTDTTWQQARFDHSIVFPLVGLHGQQPCTACHANNVYSGASTSCSGCHMPLYQKTTNPNHARAGFSTTCDTCHGAADTTWQQARFDHSIVFPLVGLHGQQPCAACHVNNVYSGAPSTCAGCHMPLYQKTSTPNHGRAGFPTTCDTCHRATDATWQQGVFNHSQFFTLVGVHATQPCAACHVNNVFAGTPSTCAGCHLTLYQRATNPNHVAAGFPTTCDTCHKATDATWQQGVFNHPQFYTLVGVHATQPCAACHVNNVFAGTPSTCAGCHLTLYQRTTNPNHVSAGFPTTCDTCHKATDATWQQGVFNHSQYYTLVGMHATEPCAACHVNNVFAGTPSSCAGCHLPLYQRATNPNHAAAGFPTTCDTCHKATDTTWQQGVFNHSQYYALVGVHATQPCAACHINNVFAGTPSTCAGCHLPLYQRTTNPNHIAAGFPTSCDTCHKATDATWQQGVFNHTWFPITSGPHAGRPCSACHTDPTNFAVFSCLTCHSAAETNPHHRGVPGYRYDSNACYACHPRGRAG